MADLDIPALEAASKAAIAAGPEQWARESDALLAKLTLQAGEIERLTVQTNRWAVRVAQAQNDRDKARDRVDALQAQVDRALNCCVEGVCEGCDCCRDGDHVCGRTREDDLGPDRSAD